MPMSAMRRLITRPNCFRVAPERRVARDLNRAPGAEAITAGPPRITADVCVEVRDRPVKPAGPRRSGVPLGFAIAMHAACLAGALDFAHRARPMAPLVVDLVVQPRPIAAIPPPSSPAAATTQPEAPPDQQQQKSSAPPLDEPTEPAAREPEASQFVAPKLPFTAPPLAAPPRAAPPRAAPVEAPAERPLPNAAAAMSPPLRPSPAPAHRQARAAAVRHTVTQAEVPRETRRAGRPSSTTALSAAADAAASARAAVAQLAAPSAHAVDQEAVLEAHIRDAVQAAVHYPAAARMMGVTGRARVQLEYRDGAVDDPLLAQSSGAPMLDHAAINAAQEAHYPPAPPQLAGRLMRFLVWVEFRSA